MTLTYDEIIEELKKHSLLLKTRKSPSLKEGSFCVEAYDQKASEESCFIFFKAVKRSSKERLKTLLNSGASLFLIDEESLLKEIPEEKTVLLVSSSREAWSYLASKSFDHPEDSLKLIAITGTNGKTSTAWMISEILSSEGEKAAYIGTLGNSITETISSPHTTPDPPILFSLLAEARKKKIKHIAIEVSSHSLVQKKVSPLRFSAAIFTSFSRDHLDFHSSMEEYLETKLSLFTRKHLKDKAPIFFGEQVRSFLSKETVESISPLFYGEQVQQKNTKSFKTIREDLSGFEISFQEEESTFNRKAPYLGSKNKENFFVSLLVAKSFLHRWPACREASIRPIPARLERLALPNKKAPLVFIDYAHTPEALRESLLELAKYKGNAKLYVLFGCGGDRDPGKRPLMGAYAEEFSDHVTVTSDNPRSEEPGKIISDILSGMKKPSLVLTIQNRQTAIQKTLCLLEDKDCLLLAGKGHENYIEEKGQKHPFSEKNIVLNFYKENLS